MLPTSLRSLKVNEEIELPYNVVEMVSYLISVSFIEPLDSNKTPSYEDFTPLHQ